MKVWWCDHRQAAFKDAAGQCPCYENPRHKDDVFCGWMQLVPIEPSPAPYDIEIPDFINRQGNW